MLKILWVEDEYSEQKQVSWFNNKSVCVKTSFDEAENTINHCLTQFDLIVLDINLENSEHTDRVKALAKQFNIAEQAFLEESGMNLFLNLLEHGFPKEQIIFLTANADINISRIDELREFYRLGDDDAFDEILGAITNGLSEETVAKCAELIEAEDIEGLCHHLENYFNKLNDGVTNNTYNRFCEAYRRCRIEPPKAINKSLNEAKQHLNHWLENHERNDYLVLRRGVIEGCNLLKTLPAESLYFNSYIPNQNAIKYDGITSYFEILENFLPLREPGNKQAIYKLFVRTLSHEWEAAKNIRHDKDKPDAVLAWIMRNTRHWITHNSSLFDALDESFVAFLFMVNLRVMFKFDDYKQHPYEVVLLKLFENKSISEQDFSNKTPPVSDAYLALRNHVWDENQKIYEKNKKSVSKDKVIDEAFYFNEMCNNIQLSNSPLRHDRKLFIQLLYQTFWLTTCNPYVDKKNNRSLEIKFGNFNYAEKLYLFELARSIYHHSFPQGEAK